MVGTGGGHRLRGAGGRPVDGVAVGRRRGSACPAPPVALVERGGELRRLRAALDRGRQGRGGVVLVYGEAGIGKTSLLRAFAAEVGEQARVLSGACEDLLTPRPLGPFRDMFRDAGLEQPRPGDGPERDRWIDALLAEMGSGMSPAVVVVEDAHWADDATLDIVRYLGRRVEDLPALLVVTYRDELDDQHPLRRIVGGFAGPATVRLALRPLSDPAVTRMAEEAGKDAAGLVRAAGGNPFYVAEALAAAGSEVPATVRDAVIARVRVLPGPAQRALEVLSVIPGETERTLLEAVLGATACVLEPAERTGLVAVRGGRIGFRHELARRAVEDSLLASRRVALNRAVLCALESAGAEPFRLVHHAVGAGDRGAVARLAPVAAAGAAAAEAHHEALAFARLALDHGDLLPAGGAARMHGIAGYALHALNRCRQAAAEAGAAVRRWQELPGSPEELGRALLLSARMQTMLGRPHRARLDAGRALLVLRPLGPGPDLAHAYGTLGNLDAIEADCASAAAWCRLSVAAARRLGRADLEAHALLYLGVARIGLGDVGGLEEMRTALRRADEAGHGEYRCRTASTLATVLIWLGRHREAEPYLAVVENAARDHGLDYHLFHTLAQRSHLDLYFGHWDAAERRLREQLAGTQDPAAVLCLPLALLGRVLARRGDSGGTALTARAWELAVGSRQSHRMALAGGALVEDAWLRGDAAAVRAAADTLLPLAERANLDYLRGEVLRYLRRCGLPAELFAGCPAGFRFGLAGDWRSAAAAWAEAGNPYEEALELAEAADPGTALDALRRLDDLGAAGTAGLVRRVLRRRGIQRVPRGPQRATRQNPAGLTPRQFAVLEVLAEGLTSAEIAERTHRSRRTVDNHVNAILSRLGVPSRRQAVGLAIDRGWLGTPPGPAPDPI